MSPQLPMDCARVEQDGAVERYVMADAAARPLSEAECAAFEAHYFACGECFERLQAARAMQAALQQPRKAKPSQPLWAFAAAAAVMIALVSYGTMRLMRPVSKPAVAARGTKDSTGDQRKIALSAMTTLDAPAYESATFRGNEDAAARGFQEAMQSYAAKNYAAAAAALTSVVQQYPRYTPARFFLGASQMLTHDFDGAIENLKQVRNARESPFQNEAQWVLAKLWLVKGDTEQALAEVQALAAGEGDFAEPARRLRDQLYNLRKQ